MWEISAQGKEQYGEETNTYKRKTKSIKYLIN